MREVKLSGNSSSKISDSPGSKSKNDWSVVLSLEESSSNSIGTICCSVGICEITDWNLL